VGPQVGTGGPKYFEVTPRFWKRCASLL